MMGGPSSGDTDLVSRNVKGMHSFLSADQSYCVQEGRGILLRFATLICSPRMCFPTTFYTRSSPDTRKCSISHAVIRYKLQRAIPRADKITRVHELFLQIASGSIDQRRAIVLLDYSS